MSKFLVSENMVTISPSQGIRVTDPTGKLVWRQAVTPDILTNLAYECMVNHHKGRMPKFHLDLACQCLDVAREMSSSLGVAK